MSTEILNGFTSGTPGTPEGAAQTANANANVIGLSGITSAIGALTRGYGQSQNYKAQAKAANFNAGIASQNAASVGEENATEIENRALADKAQIGRQEAAFGQSNTGGVSGTAALVVRQSQINNEMGLLTQQYQGNMKQTSLINQAALDRYYGGVATENAGRAMTEGGLSATAALVSGFGRYTGARIPTPVGTTDNSTYLSTTPTQFQD